MGFHIPSCKNCPHIEIEIYPMPSITPIPTGETWFCKKQEKGKDVICNKKILTGSITMHGSFNYPNDCPSILEHLITPDPHTEVSEDRVRENLLDKEGEATPQENIDELIRYKIQRGIDLNKSPEFKEFWYRNERYGEID